MWLINVPSNLHFAPKLVIALLKSRSPPLYRSILDQSILLNSSEHLHPTSWNNCCAFRYWSRFILLDTPAPSSQIWLKWPKLHMCAGGIAFMRKTLLKTSYSKQTGLNAFPRHIRKSMRFGQTNITVRPCRLQSTRTTAWPAVGSKQALLDSTWGKPPMCFQH